MPDKKLTDNEIIKALKTLLELVLYEGCQQRAKTISLAIDIINRQKEEIENYSNNTKTMSDSIYKMQKLIESKNAEIERLRDALIDNEYANCVAVKNGLIYTHTLGDYDKLIGDISTEAIKEFAERLVADLTLLAKHEDEFRQGVILGVIHTIEEKKKEMVGENNEN
jgi:hypothetical protein